MSAGVEKYDTRVSAVGSLLCVGLDSDIDRIPEVFRNSDLPQFFFNQWIIDTTHPYVAAYKPNIAFYEARGAQGLNELQMTMRYLREQHPDIFTICDAKRADIGDTNTAYVTAIFDELGFDAVTLHPYLGREALFPFLGRKDKCCIILCHTSNPGADEFQGLLVDGKPIWEIVAERVTQEWNANGNCMLVMGATYLETLRRVRAIAGDMTLLIPGIGAQGGDIERAVAAGVNNQKRGIILNAARSVIFSDQPGNAARNLRDIIRLAIPR